VDDDPLIQYSVKALLDRLGHLTTTIASGEEALAKLEEGYRPEVVILDLNMPGLGGAGTLSGLRTILPKVPVILTSGEPSQAVADMVALYPDVAFLAKPFTLDDLRKILEQLGF
jgi:CheY-like chemotaxis protein